MRRVSRRMSTFALALGIAAALWPGVANAQRRKQAGASLPRPQLLGVYPLGVQGGSTTDLSVRGVDLEAVDSLWFDHPGLRAFHLKGSKFRVVCAPGTPPGHHDVRAVGKYGVSNPRTLVVGDRPESAEAEPNNVAAKATVIAVNSSVDGEIGAAVDVDLYSFQGKAGQRLFTDLEAERVDSRLDATLRLLDARGRELAESRDAYGVDPFLDVTLPADGTYFLKVHDVTFRGNPTEYAYRLTLSDGPRVDAVVPAVARGGGPTTFTLIGRNLGGSPYPDPSFDGRPLETTTVTLDIPKATDLDAERPPRLFVSSAAATRRGIELTHETPAGRSNPTFVAVGVDPVVIEAEPNDGPEQVQTVTPPCDISACFAKPGDFDVFRFNAKKGEVWWIEVDAERLGSPADPLFTLQRVKEKGATSDLATAEDTPDRGGLARFNTGSVDASLRWTVPDDGVYQVVVSDLYGSQRGDVRLSYRLNIRPERPDFQIVLLPDSPDQPDSLTLNAGGRALAYVLANRVDGFAGPISVEAVDLPPSVRCEPVVIAAGQNLAPLVFEAPSDAPPALGTARLLGRARLNPGSESEQTHEALGGSMVWGPTVVGNNNNQANPSAPARLTRGFVLKVVDAAPLTLTATPASKVVTPGSLFSVDLAAARREGFTEAVALTLVNPPPGVTAPPTATIAKGSESAPLFFPIPRSLAEGTYTLVFQGAGPYPFSKDPAAKTKPNVTLSEPSNPVTIRVRSAPATVSVATMGTLKPGGSVELTVTVTPKDKTLAEPGPYPVRLLAPASLKLSAEPGKAEAGKPLTLVVKAAPDSPVGLAAGLAVRASVGDPSGTVDIDEPYTLTLAK